MYFNTYYLNTEKQSEENGGNYELHKETCSWCHPYNSNFQYVGVFNNDITALNTAKIKNPDKANEIDGCAHCCKSVHKE